jgi:hypothetical protein
MYFGFLHTHNLLRYIILILFVINLINIWKGFLKKEEWKEENDKIIKYLSISVDVQLIIGLILYFFLSTIVQSAFNDFGSAMKDSLFRFFTVEHTFAMLISIVLIHVGKAKVNGIKDREKKFKTAVIFFTSAFVIMIAAIPWPFYSFGRGLF